MIIKKVITKGITIIDIILAIILLLIIFSIIFFSTKANMENDALIQYSMLSSIVGQQEIIPNYFFTKMGLPGYPLFSVPIYFITDKVSDFVSETKTTSINQGGSGRYPKDWILFSEIPFKNIKFDDTGGIFLWKVSFSVILTSIIFLFLGIVSVILLLKLRKENIVGYSIPFILILSSPIVMSYLEYAPVYPTFIAFGLSSLFTYFFVKSFITKNEIDEILTGVMLGLLIISRLEGVVICATVVFGLYLYKEKRFMRNIINPVLFFIIGLLVFNLIEFGNPFTFGFTLHNLNYLGINFAYWYINLFDPNSGLIFWSPVLVLGLLGLIKIKEKYARILLFSAIILIFFFLLRIPSFYGCQEPTVIINAIYYSCPDPVSLARYDINRYSIVLVPFAAIGLLNIISSLIRKILNFSFLKNKKVNENKIIKPKK